MAFSWLINGGYQLLTSPGMIFQVVYPGIVDELNPYGKTMLFLRFKTIQ